MGRPGRNAYRTRILVMSNSYFQFKQFRVEQGRSAMKVSTDACIQGAWTPVQAEARKVLDIGAGTGLLSLMMAQRFPQLEIDAVELNEDAAHEAADNIAASPWSARIRVHQGDVRELELSPAYDVVICNPPFFTDHLHGDDDSRNSARHAHTLSAAELEHVLRRSLKEGGRVSLLLPVTEWESRAAYLERCGWFLLHRLDVRSKAEKQPERIVSIWARHSDQVTIREELTVYRGHNQYTAEAGALLRDFYLRL